MKTKSAFPASLLCAVAILSGCVSSPRGMVLDPVGPPVLPVRTAPDHGSLVVFSAYVSGAVPNVPDEIKQHSDFDLQTADGRLLQTVHNLSGAFGQDPLRVDLPAGHYIIVAPSNRYGLVTVPVLIASHQTTTLHLEGDASWPNQEAFNSSNSVRLSDGEIVGWKSGENDPARTTGE
jgi:hypothetical protein